MSITELLRDWPSDPLVLLGIGASALLYWRGLRYSVRRGLARHLRPWHALAFASGLLVLLIALDSPLDVLANELLWAHMVQHELLTLIAPPLLLLGQPTWLLWRGVPLPIRRAGLGWVIRQRWPRRMYHAISQPLRSPVAVWVLFTASFSVWHIPALYDLALERTPFHVLEHVMFWGTALLFWSQVIPARHTRPALSLTQRAIYLGAAGLYSNVVGALFVFSTGPMYSYYAALPRGAGALSVLADQHLAGAAMDLPGTVVFFIAIIALLGFWLQEDERAPDLVTSTAIAKR
jgi:cytochrome c oxidase assembly factor CtaG